MISIIIISTAALVALLMWIFLGVVFNTLASNLFYDYNHLFLSRITAGECKSRIEFILFGIALLLWPIILIGSLLLIAVVDIPRLIGEASEGIRKEWKNLPWFKK